ncbi:hypothetical protein [Pararhizobium qamdonense]|uniref:hypothetical protein n=1 Tax=Pararhizobium qamdonense TaxID=3031126 RepID=UPI0023E1F5DD|nr:hypothetical protein [Pararhizobium qamdonense]
MKIVDRKTFLTLPAGAVYCQASQPYGWDDIRIKSDTAFTEGTGDWYETSLTNIEASGSDELFDRWDDMKNNGVSYPLDIETVGRDGLFQSQAIFLVYEKEDLAKLRDFFVKAVSECK